MKCIRKFPNLLVLLLGLISLSLTGQESNQIWKITNLSDVVVSKQLDLKTFPKSYRVYEVDEQRLQQTIGPKSTQKGKDAGNQIYLSFPDATGEFERFKLEEKSLFAPELQAKFPNIKSFVGISVENPTRKVHISTSEFGMNAVIFDEIKGSYYIDKINNTNAYVAYQRKDAHSDRMECLVQDQVMVVQKSQLQARTDNANDGILRTFRLAIATTGEYSQYHITDRGINVSAPDSQKIAAVLDAINVAMTRVNALFERDVALTMQLVGNNDELIFLNPETDGFSNDDTNALINESQAKIDEIVGNANYDIGHTFSTGAGGLAQLNGPCVSGSKARAVTGIAAPKGDAFYVDFVAHEMGHQFGANHTFNGTAGNCSGNENSASAVEPGSGTTIMGYAGICAPENVQNSGDDYFHLVSIREMWQNISQGFSSSCAQITAKNNTAPELEALENYTIPISTPFALNVNATDAQDDLLTYTWEQLDNETAPLPLVSTSTGGPAFRSLKPSERSVRYFPNLQTTLSGSTSNTWEVLPSVERTMHFGVTVRDNNAEVGQTSSEETILSVTETAGPFVVTSQSNAVNWDAGTLQTVTWDVANTDSDPVNCQFVTILLSVNGGLSFDQVLAENVPNDGSHNVVAPGLTTSNARIMVQSVGNVFFAVNEQEFSIQNSEFIMEFVETEQQVCAPENSTFNFNFKTFLGFSETTTFSASGLPNGASASFSPASASANDTVVEMTIEGLSESEVGSYEITVTGTSNSVVKQTLVNLELYTSNIASPVLIEPAAGSSNIKKPYMLSWGTDSNVQSYLVEVASNVEFGNIVDQSVLSESIYTPSNLDANTTYFWRVKGQNICGESAYSEVRSFSTENEVCTQFASVSTPLTIPDNTPAGVVATVEVTEAMTITDVNVGVTVDHTWVGDLRLLLSDPSGNSVVLVSNSDRSGQAYTNTIFDDQAEIPIGSGLPPFTGSFAPEGSLALFNEKASLGTWTLSISDNEAQDVGSLENFFLQICGIPFLPGDSDGDGVPDSEDLCPNTPLGMKVDATGCVQLDGDHFTVNTLGETCIDLNNGRLEITAKMLANYTAEFNGTTFNFTSGLSIEDLAPGNYNLCLSLEGDTFEQCYVLTIQEGVQISAKSTLSNKNLEIEILEGTAPFRVFKNNQFLFETSKNLFDLDVVHGDVISVASSKDCEGIYADKILLSDEVILYPNPADSYVTISIPSDRESVYVEIYNVSGQLMIAKEMEVLGHQVVMEIDSLAKGLYFVRVALEQPVVLQLLKS